MIKLINNFANFILKLAVSKKETEPSKMIFERLKKKDYKKITGTDGYETNQNHLILRFLDFDFSPDLITDKLGLKPQSAGQKGDEYFLGSQKKKFKSKRMQSLGL